MEFRQDRYYAHLYQPSRESVRVAPGFYETGDLEPDEPGLYAFTAIAYAIGYVLITPYNAEAI